MTFEQAGAHVEQRRGGVGARLLRSADPRGASVALAGFHPQGTVLGACPNFHRGEH